MFKLVKSRIRRIKAGGDGWIDRVLKGTSDHYRCFFPKRKSGCLKALFEIIFSGIRVDESQISVIRKIPQDAIVIYAHKYKSYFDYLFYHTRYTKENLPVPEIGFDYRFFLLQPVSRSVRIFLAHTRYFFQKLALQNPYDSGYIRRELAGGRSGLLALVEKGGFYLRFVKSNPDPLRYLIEMQATLDRPVFIVPQLLFFGKKPLRSTPSFMDMLFGSEENPGRIRRIFAMLKKPESIFLEISEPVNLKEFMALPENRDLSPGKQALALRQRLLIQINRHRQSITGPVLKSLEELKENILTNDRLRAYMEHYAENRKIPLYKVYKEADGYIDEIAAKYNINMIRISAMGVKWLINGMFEGVSVNTEVLNRIKAMSRRGPLVLVPCHKSHIDYLILSYILFQNDMPCPHIAAGKNLSFWPLGPIFRSGGAFFIRRTFKGAVLYSKVFSEYVYKILEEGFNIEFFIEGGRSRTGKLLQPKLGLLSILLSAFREGANEDLIFVPVFVGYDRVLEESAYLHELEGGEKKPESLLQVVKARKFLKRRYGRIYIRFHDGISLTDLLARQGTTIQDMTVKEQNRFCRQLGYQLVNSIDKVSVITPHAVVAGAILNGGRQRFSLNHLMDDVQTYINYLMAQKASLADTLLMDPTHAFDYVIDAYIQRKFIEPLSEDKDTAPEEKGFSINVSKRPALEYYKNNCVNAFIPAAYTALSILEKDAFQFSGSDIYAGYRFLQEFFINEFSHDADKTPEFFVHKNIKAFIDDAILSPHPTLPDTYNLTSAGFRKLKLFSAFLTTYFESYWVTLNFFARYPKNFIEAKDRIKKAQSMANRLYKKKEIEHPEAISIINFKNAVDYFVAHGIRGAEDEEPIGFYMNRIRRYMDLLHS
ncbi:MULTISPECIES: 1-acyl-sn-glycerol-3-phosphate acyltransferase [Desulfococcus]|uniref:Glycerol-3-phosphate acyltransferase n=1 Tax=Desulfococcus multivorans DSM 2059 TaxID=1121405 RepID=S7V8K9_DESML|nr:1-acyl-sn-glycerol-3-phosphate acyltransferase [Desulfococcus multivorans]AOY59282.1 PlsB: glycerol-3-phosphate acyltransferase [Desulfococcus multivorans]AQV01504.1 hypothetical protein B2D07_12550 [Desulfococcus multivorans]EPR43024.1 phospholipid/glycerol acyltransferase [Desulfococcus multivorans DSM 2059]SKA14952.1 glycerol-3-phosphate acyltransferase [Desulfococcus multivorans DSM 2059]